MALASVAKDKKFSVFNVMSDSLEAVSVSLTPLSLFF